MVIRELDLEVPPDTGCRYEPACLTCSLPFCAYEDSGKERAATTREAQIAAFVADYAKLPALPNGFRIGVERLATQHGIGRRTAYRWARAREGA